MLTSLIGIKRSTALSYNCLSKSAQKRADKALDRAHEIELLDMKQGAEMDAYKHNMGIYERESQRNRTAALVSGIASLGAMLAI